MKVLVLGAGGREHALAWALAQSPKCTAVFAAPGNPGTAELGANLNLDPTDPQAVLAACKEHGIERVVVGPEAPLVAGVADVLAANGLDVVGPNQAGARLEGSKVYAKQFMARHGIPTASFRAFTANELEDALAYVANHPLPVVIKADGLAAGKGVVVTEDRVEARQTVEAMLSGARHGQAGTQVVVEEYISGVEVSCLAVTDGQAFQLLPFAKDYKRLGEGDTGPNTGGMGAVSPLPFVDRELRHRIMFDVLEPTLKGLQAEGVAYRGFLFVGLMIHTEQVHGEPTPVPYVLEYNVRLGDPETQCVIPRLQTDLMDLFDAMQAGTLRDLRVAVQAYNAVTIVCASQGYPGAYAKGQALALPQDEGVLVFQAGTRRDDDGQLRTHGGRVLAVTGIGKSLPEAKAQALAGVQAVDFEGKIYRTDVGDDVLRLTTAEDGTAAQA